MYVGSERFSFNGHEIDISILNFWQWAYSNLFNNIIRSSFAEYIVSSALGITNQNKQTGLVRKPYTLLSKDGYRVGVKSSAYIQSFDDEHPNYISFQIEPFQNDSDVYIFCLYKAMYKDESPLNLNLWDFYVLSTKVLNMAKPTNKIITLQALLQLEPMWCDYYGIGAAIKIIMNV